MTLALFSNETEKVYFYNLLAARKLKDKRLERQNYEKEIETALNKCGEILEMHGARVNFIAEIDKIESEMEPKGILPTANSRESKDTLETINSLTTELTDLLKKIPREISEDLEFFSKQIIDRRMRREETLEKEKEIIELYPEVEKIDKEQIFIALKHIFDNIRLYTGEVEEVEEELEESNVIDFQNARQKVIGIKQASRNLLKKTELSLEESNFDKELSKPITKTNTGLFGIMDDVFSNDNKKEPNKVVSIPVINEEELNTKPELEELKEAEITVLSSDDLEPIEEIEQNEPNIEVAIIEEPEIEIKEEPEIEKEPEIKQESKNDLSIDNEIKEEQMVYDEENTVEFSMPDNFTLTELAMATCDDPIGWIDIYEVNKDLFDKVIEEKNQGNSKDIENNKHIFAGLTIKVPTVFNKGQEKEEPIQKVA